MNKKSVDRADVNRRGKNWYIQVCRWPQVSSRTAPKSDICNNARFYSDVSSPMAERCRVFPVRDISEMLIYSSKLWIH